MASQAALASALAYGLIASYCDLRMRRIPNPVTYFFFVLALAIAFTESKLSPAYATGVALAFAFAYAAYKVGAWAGGDAKFFTALCAHYLLLRQPSEFAFVTLFLNSAVALLPVAAIIYWRRIAMADLKLRENAVPSAKSALLAAFLGTLFSSVYAQLGGGVAPTVEAAALSAAGVFAVAFAASLAVKVFPAFARQVFRRVKTAGELVPGDIPARSVFLSKGKIVLWSPPSPGEALRRAFSANNPRALELGKPEGELLADSFKARGMTAGDIGKLKENGVKQLEVRESIALSPVLLAGFALSLFAPWV